VIEPATPSHSLIVAQIAAREAAHQWSLASLRGRSCGRPPRWQPAHALGRHTDVGHWDLSPEWFGTQAGGWGRGAGEVVFQQKSELGNGEVDAKPWSLRALMRGPSDTFEALTTLAVDDCRNRRVLLVAMTATSSDLRLW
jgi:hypothetical protein